MHPAIAHLVAVAQVETGEPRTPGTNSLHPDSAHLATVGHVETGETWTPGANSPHLNIANLAAGVHQSRLVSLGHPAPVKLAPMACDVS